MDKEHCGGAAACARADAAVALGFAFLAIAALVIGFQVAYFLATGSRSALHELLLSPVLGTQALLVAESEPGRSPRHRGGPARRSRFSGEAASAPAATVRLKITQQVGPAWK